MLHFHLKKEQYAYILYLGLFHSAEGHWDPEIWFRSFDSSHGTSPITTGGVRERKRPADLDKESIYKRKTGRLQ